MGKHVPPIGPTNARIVFVGEAPGADEERRGEPFVGKAGKLQDILNTNAGIRREECYWTNLIKERPPRNDIKHYFSKPGVPNARGAPHIEAFWEEMRTLDPNVVVPLGAYPTATLLGTAYSIQRVRGHVERAVNGWKCIPCFHPAAALRMPALNAVTRFDLRKVAREAESPLFPWRERTTITQLPSDDTLRILAAMQEKAIKTGEIAFDFETAYPADKPIPTMISFATTPVSALTVPLLTEDGRSAHAAQVLGDIWAVIRLIMYNERITKVAQNAAFDLSVLKAVYDINMRGPVFDTMVAHACLYPNLEEGPSAAARDKKQTGKKGLEFLTSLYTNEPLHKKGRTSIPQMCAIDSAVTLECAQVLETLLKKEPARWATYERTMANMRPTLAMTARGVGWDAEEQERLATDLTVKVADATVGAREAIEALLTACESLPEEWVLTKVCKANYKTAAYGTGEYWAKVAKLRSRKSEGAYAAMRAAGRDTADPLDRRPLMDALVACLNPNSTDQIKHLFYVIAGVKEQKRKRKRSTENREETTTSDDEALRTIWRTYAKHKGAKGRSIASLALAVLALRRVMKALTTYARIKVSDDGRFRAAYNIVGTYTGRFSTSKWFDRGTNIQNFPREGRCGVNVRNMLVADEGCVLLEFDLEQAEDRYVSWDAVDPVAMRLYNEGRDVYKVVASWVFGVDEEAVTKRQRSMSKMYKLAWNYDIGPRRLLARFAKEGFEGITEADCKKGLRRLTQRFPATEQRKRAIEALLARGDHLETPFGRRSRFMGRKDDTMFRAGYAFQPQSAIGELTNHVMRRVYDELLPDEPDVALLMQQHDAIVLGVPLFEAARIVERVMPLYDYPLELAGGTLVIPASVQVGVRWGEMYDAA